VLEPGAHAVVISPHCDDAVYSLGALLSGHVRRGGTATVVTVLAGDPTSTTPPGEWDARAGFRSQGEATVVRRREDAAACAVVGAAHVHLDDVDEQYPRRLTDGELWSHLEPHVRTAGELLVPGGPMSHADHRVVTRLVVTRSPHERLLRLYREEPYAYRHAGMRSAHPPPAFGPEPWLRVRPAPQDAVSKLRACARYRTQNPLLIVPGRRRQLVGLPRMLWWSAQVRGEGITAPARAGVLRAEVLALKDDSETGTGQGPSAA
jgi:LmbE family N-acetylglucosaminyl deacetylase